MPGLAIHSTGEPTLEEHDLLFVIRQVNVPTTTIAPRLEEKITEEAAASPFLSNYVAPRSNRLQGP